MNENFNEDAIAKIAETVSERLITSRQQEIISSSLNATQQLINNSISQFSLSIENTLRSSENSAKNIAQSTVNQAISSLKSELTTEIKTSISSETKIIESRIAELIKKIEELSEEKKENKESDFNYTTRGTYEGQEVRFALSGQVLTPEEAVEFGNINYIEFGGDGFAFRLFPTTTGGTDPEPRIGVQYGEINGQPPSGIENLYSPADGQILYLNISFSSNGSFQQSSIAVGGSLPTSTPTSLYLLIGQIALADGTYTITRQSLCGDVIIRRQDICINGDTYVDFAFVKNLTPIENT